MLQLLAQTQMPGDFCINKWRDLRMCVCLHRTKLRGIIRITESEPESKMVRDDVNEELEGRCLIQLRLIVPLGMSTSPISKCLRSSHIFASDSSFLQMYTWEETFDRVPARYK